VHLNIYYAHTNMMKDFQGKNKGIGAYPRQGLNV
jgi:hypothetical protein